VQPPPRLHPDILKLGLVSFLTDLSSEMIFSVFALFFTTVAGASSALLGLIEGLADFSASSLNLRLNSAETRRFNVVFFRMFAFRNGSTG
jgi:hypothetical protein